jgi:FAD synthase
MPLSRLAFVARLRDELNFTSVASLIEQIHVDVADAEKILASQGFVSTM